MAQPDTRATELTAGATNAVGQLLSALGDEWALLVIQQALLGATRYGQFMARLPISNSVLTRRLSTLTEEGLLARHRYQDRPARDEYLVTARSRSLWPVLLSIWDWERHWVTEHRQTLPAMHHRQCGAGFTPRLSCGGCGRPVHSRDVSARWGPSGCWSRSVPTGTNRRRPGAGRRDSPAGLFPQTMSVLGNRWACAILTAAFAGTTRFCDFQKLLTAPPGSIADRLQTFRDNGILAAADQQPDYRLTAKGEAFFPVLVTALQWGQRWFLAPEGPAVILEHKACDQQFTLVSHCDQCGGKLSGTSIETV